MRRFHWKDKKEEKGLGVKLSGVIRLWLLEILTLTNVLLLWFDSSTLMLGYFISQKCYIWFFV